MADPPLDLARHEAALLLWAKYQLPDWVRGKLDPADLVQQTLLEAVKASDKLVGRPEHEVLAYLRRALANNTIDAARKFARNRDEVSPDALAESSVRLADWLAADQTSPSERVARNERFGKLAVAISELPTTQRVVIEMRYLQGLKVNEIARNLGKSEGAISLVLHRAITTLRDTLTELVS
jgi:RNA polymerase sigma-70 factor (ECF subfamily)